MPTLTRPDEVFLLDLGADDNTVRPEWLDAVNAALDEVERASGPRALVAIGSGKVWSNGLDLPWLMANPDQAKANITALHHLYARLLGFPVPTVAALQGHAFGGGAMLALAFDSRIMRADRGYWCLPEADLGIPFSPGMSALVQARLAPPAAHEAMVTARRWTGPDALAAGIVDAVGDADGLLRAATELARSRIAHAKPQLGVIKARMYAGPIATLLAAEVDLASLRP